MKRSLRWPTPYEYGSLLLAAGALAVSVLSYLASKESYDVSRATEDAQQEHLAIRCSFPNDIQARHGDILILAGTAVLVNNSRLPLNITWMEASQEVWGGDISVPEKPRVGVDKHGADYSIADRDITLEPAKSARVRYAIDIKLRPEVAAAMGSTDPKSVIDLNSVLSLHSIDMAGNTYKFDGRWRRSGEKLDLEVDFVAYTSRGNIVAERCGPDYPVPLF